MAEENTETTLTLEQTEQRREKNRVKRARQRARKLQETLHDKPLKENPEPVKAPQKKPQERRARLSNEEYAKQQLEFKSKRIEMNPKDAVVSIAEATEAKTLAYNVSEVNTIAEYVRSNLGSRVPMDLGILLINTFQEGVAKTIEDYIKLANSQGIGSRRALALYKEVQTKEKNRAVAQELFREKTIESETPEETKEREAQEKALEKATAELAKATAELAKAKEALVKAEELEAEAEKVLDAGFEKRHADQKEREKAEAAKAREAAKAAAEEVKIEKAKAREAAKAAAEEVKIEKADAAV
ncbi:hypothetical protein [Sulfurimonas sp.]|uniref:hypothetical protein n=1 Tax=Sulfurimonas sp. TaxID=2022749 RepID=UPI0025E3ED96|nr:hypothetical protein [Sulfurimonas sp.]MBW6487476.1 hypothetical protein [Sulfurimonas sp.]